MVVHHLEPADAVALLREMARVARLGVVVNDLVRGRLFWVGRLADEPRRDAEPVDAERRAAVGPAGVQPGGAARRSSREAGLDVVAEIDGFAGTGSRSPPCAR